MSVDRESDAEVGYGSRASVLPASIFRKDDHPDRAALCGTSDHTGALFPALKMRQQFGFLLQFAVLIFLPLLIVWQLNFGFKLLWMPTATVAGIVVFLVGTKLRES